MWQFYLSHRSSSVTITEKHCTGWQFYLFKTSHWLQNKCSVLARPGQARPKRNFSFEVNGRFWTSGIVTLYYVKMFRCNFQLRWLQDWDSFDVARGDAARGLRARLRQPGALHRAPQGTQEGSGRPHLLQLQVSTVCIRVSRGMGGCAKRPL